MPITRSRKGMAQNRGPTQEPSHQGEVDPNRSLAPVPVASPNVTPPTAEGTTTETSTNSSSHGTTAVSSNDVTERTIELASVVNTVRTAVAGDIAGAAVRTPVDVTAEQSSTQNRPASRTGKTEPTLRSEKSSRRLKAELAAKEEIAKCELEYARARLARLQEESPSEDEDGSEPDRRLEVTRSWVQDQEDHRREQTQNLLAPPPRDTSPGLQLPAATSLLPNRSAHSASAPAPPYLIATAAPTRPLVAAEGTLTQPSTQQQPGNVTNPYAATATLPAPPSGPWRQHSAVPPTPPAEPWLHHVTTPNALPAIVPPQVITLEALVTALSSRNERRPQDAPKYMHELPKFDGTGGEWLSFKTAFRDTASYFSNAENLARIRRSLFGAAKDTVQSLLLSQPTPADIIAALERRFGRPDALVLLEMENLKRLPNATDSARELCIFASNVNNVVATVEALNKKFYLYSPEMLQLIIDKMTSVTRFRWYDYVAANESEDAPVLVKIARFLNEEADKCGAFAKPETCERDNNTGPRRRDTPRRIDKAFAADENEHKRSNRSEHKRSDENEHKRLDKATCPQCSGEHYLVTCTKFLAAPNDERWKMAVETRTCFKCLKSRHRRLSCRAKPCGIDGCNMNHHKLLHKKKEKYDFEASEEIAATASTNSVFLKIVPVTLTGPKAKFDTFALLDEGSTVTMINAAVAQKLGVKGRLDPLRVLGIGGARLHTNESRRVDVRIRGKHGNQEHDLVGARTIDQLRFPPQTIDEKSLNDCKYLADLLPQLAYKNATPTVLIGQDNWPLIVSRELKGGRRDKPVASLTQLGWVLHGCRSSITEPLHSCAHATMTESEFDILAREHFRLESLCIEAKTTRNDPEQRALRVLDATTQRLIDGRFQTGLIWRQDNLVIPNNREAAFRRLTSLERKLEQNNELKTKYHAQMKHLIDSGYAELANLAPTQGRTWYLPHFAVVNPAKPKIRIVHDAAARSHGISLNDLLLPGPDLLQSLPGVLMKFRQHPIAVSADIKEMFLQIRIRTEDRDALRFLWRENVKHGAPLEYRMTSVTFGAASSPCTAIYIKNRNADDFKEKWPQAAKAVTVNHYMDDYLQSFKTLEEAQRTSSQVAEIHRAARFELRGWATNCVEALDTTVASDQACHQVELGGRTPYTKTLGMRWNTEEDYLSFSLNFQKVSPDVITGQTTPTKREALSVIMSLFDPLGLVTPATTPTKQLLQETWRRGIDWDDELPTELKEKWSTWLQNLDRLQILRIPRCYDIGITIEKQLHTFVDASEVAYAAAVYWRFVRNDKASETALVCAKSRVTPLKSTSIPRLELQAALLGSRLAKTVEEGHDENPAKRFFWSDSRTTLTTLLAEAENTINSRPLTHVAVTPDDLEALTPNHILLGAGSHLPAPGKFLAEDVDAKVMWRRAQQLADEFWKRWLREYLPLLQHRREPRGSGPVPKIGDIVIIVDPNLPRNVWPRGRIKTVYPGKDGVTRVVDVFTGGKIFRRPVKKIVVLPTEIAPSGDGGSDVTDDK